MNRKMIILAAVLMVLAGLSSWSKWRKATAIDPTDARQVAHGRELYSKHCGSCHGADLQGEPDWQRRKPNGELPAPPHDATGHTWHHPDEQLFAIVKHGPQHFAPPGYKTAMPAFVGKLSDADIRAVLAYIESTWPEDIRERQGRLNAR
jgi:mono/diheme cytochrome c family protein